MVNSPAGPQGLIITFYSYKGGVGRTMALANVAALLAQGGQRVLVVDWDLEAPGVEKYFSHYLGPGQTRESTPGVVDLILAWAEEKPMAWREALLRARLSDSRGEVHLLSAGRATPDYVQRMRSLHFEGLFEHHGLGNHLEQLREEWREAYDFVLIDSRTGITDIGGICTVHLPDILVALFTTNIQSLEGTRFILSHARKEHASLPVDRRRLLTVPVLARDETENLPDEAKVWHQKAAAVLGEFYQDWLPRDVPPVKAVELLKLPYVPVWSLGERLPVLEQGTANPRYLGFAYELLTRLLASGVDWSEVLTGALRSNSTELRARLAEEERLKVQEALRRAEQELNEARARAEQERRRIESQADKDRRRTRGMVAGLVLLAFILGVGLWQWKLRNERTHVLNVLNAAVASPDPLERVLLVAEMEEQLKPEDFSFLQANEKGYLPEMLLLGRIPGAIRVAYSPDNRLILGLGANGSIQIWDAETGRTLADLRVESKAAVTGAIFSPDSTRVLTYGYDGIARLWSRDAEHGPLMFQGHEAEITGASFSLDGRRILTSSEDGTARVWDAATGRVLGVLSGHSRGVTSAWFSPDGSHIVTASRDGKVLVWDAATSRALAGFMAHPGGVTSASFSWDGTRILTSGEDGTARIWNAAFGKLLDTLQGHTGGVTSAWFSLDGSRIVTASRDGTARVWDAATGKLLATLLGHTGGVTSASFNRDGTRILTSGEDGTVRLWNAESGKLLIPFTVGNSNGAGAIFSPDGRYFLLAGKDDTGLVDASSGQPIASLGGSGSVRRAAFAWDSQHLLTIDEEGSGRVWAVPPTSLQWSDPQKAISKAVHRACLTPAQRVKYLQEEPAEADRLAKDCEAQRAGSSPGN
jgi:WD40 repeat protein